MSKHLIRVFPRDYVGAMKLYIAVNKEVGIWPDNIVFVPEDEAIRMDGTCDSAMEAVEFMNLPPVKRLWERGSMKVRSASSTHTETSIEPEIKQWWVEDVCN